MRHAERPRASPPAWLSSGEGPPRSAHHTRPREVAKAAYIVLMERAHSLTSFSTTICPSPVGSPRSVPSRRGRPRRSHRRGRQAPALRPRSLALDVRVLHGGPPPLRGRGLPPHRRRPCLARASPPPDHARRREAAPDSDREAGPAPDPGELGGPPEPGRPPVEARDRGTGGGAFAPSGCSGGDAEAARPTARDDVASPAPRSGRQGACRTPSAGRCFSRPPTASRRSRGNWPRTASAGSGSPARLSPGPARGSRAPRPGPLQGPVHRLRRASRQARAAAGPHALLGARRRPGRDRRGDGGRCRYEDEQGRRCTARHGLEFHHRRPFGHGGDHSVDNVALACKCHNAYLADIDYGRETIVRHRRSGARPLELTPSPSP